MCRLKISDKGRKETDGNDVLIVKLVLKFSSSINRFNREVNLKSKSVRRISALA